jgi:DNA-directed RNA polymerase subunit RPC12/RpoP
MFKCIKCHTYFQLPELPLDNQTQEMTVTIACPTCGHAIRTVGSIDHRINYLSGECCSISSIGPKLIPVEYVESARRIPDPFGGDLLYIHTQLSKQESYTNGNIDSLRSLILEFVTKWKKTLQEMEDLKLSLLNNMWG